MKAPMMKNLLFGTAGIPISANPRTTQGGISQVRKLGLSALELEFVHSVNISAEKAPLVKETAQQNDIVLTCHAPYFINLNSAEEKKVWASIQRIVQSAQITNLCGGYSVCFHAGFYMGAEPANAFSRVKENIKKIVNTLNEQGNSIWVRPETTGKATQFGDLDEILRLSAEFDTVMPCIDFSHFHARTNGKYNTLEEFRSILASVEKILGKRGLANIHAHVAGIAYGPKGEKNHLNLEESDFNFKDLMQALKEFDVSGVVISESPNIEGDALLMQKVYAEII